MLAYIRPRGKRSPHAGGTSLPSFESTAVVTQMYWFELEFVALVCFISQRVTTIAIRVEGLTPKTSARRLQCAVGRAEARRQEKGWRRVRRARRVNLLFSNFGDFVL